jgi:signal transduction histidine kinase
MVSDTAIQLMRAEMGVLLALDEDGETIQSFKVSGLFQEPHCIAAEADILHLPYRQGAVVRLADIHDDPQAMRFSPGCPQIGAVLAVPLMNKGHAMGTLFVGNRPHGPSFDADDERLLLAFASQAAIAIENSRLCAQSKELTILRERQRLAGVLHNTVAQHLFAIGLEARSCIENSSPDEQVERRLQTIRRLAAHGSRHLRSAIFALHKPYLAEGDDLPDLLEAQVMEFQTRTHIAASFIVSPQFPTLLLQISDAIYRIVCESLANVNKHAYCQAVIVTLHCDDDSVTITVQDDGVGLSEEPVLSPDHNGLHFGVATMRQLTEDLQGDFLIRNTDDQGVLVRARFRLPAGSRS